MNPLAVILAAAAAVLLILWLRRPVATYRKYRGKRLITCPENRRAATVEVSAADAAMMSAFGERLVGLKDCSRWPERKGCGQECLAQIEAAPDGCRLGTIIRKWYSGKHCCYCQAPVDPSRWEGHDPGLTKPGGRPVQWSSFRPEALPEVLAQYEPVCWNCFVTESVRRSHPDIITEREDATHRSA